MLPGCETLRLTRLFVALALATFSLAGSLRAADRITAAVDDSQRIILPGHVSPRLAAATDEGPVEASMQLPYVMLVLQPSSSQMAELTEFLEQLQTPGAPNYHAWLTPEQYGAKFGLGQNDIDKISSWLRQYNLTVKSVARGKNTIAFGGTAAQMEGAFKTEIHHYLVNGVEHYANNADPSVPAAFQGVVQAVQGLNDIRLRPMLRRSMQPHYNIAGQNVLGPGDIATIYDINPLYSAGIDGSGENLVVVGQTEIEMSDIENFRSQFGLASKNPSTLLVPGSPNPGIQSQSGDLGESDLDLELSGAIARNASIQFVYATDVMVAFQYAIDENLAPVISISYGDCEQQTPTSQINSLVSWGMQANMQGQTIFAAAGDDGARDCSGGDNPATNNAVSVDTPASMPYVTGVGGTTFNEGGGNYWNSSNGSNGASAKSYIPETTWNDGVCEAGTQEQPEETLCATGGGASVDFTKPSWQTGKGVPADGARDVPDVAIAASPNHDPYLIISGGQEIEIGGTSCGAPQFAGITLLLQQYLTSKGYQSSPSLGNVNPAIYQNLAVYSGVFHDITTGNNMVPACTGNTCSGAVEGFSAGPGYDQVTGWGTPDITNYVQAWHASGVTAKITVTMSASASPSHPAFTDTVTLAATVSAATGSAPTGTVTFTLGSETLGSAAVNSGTATLAIPGIALAVGGNTITAQYSGDDSHLGASETLNVVESTPANGPPNVQSISNSASYTQSFAPGGIVSIFGTGLAPASGGAFSLPLPTMLAGTTVTIGGYPAAIFYASPTQLNVQVPYEVSTGSALEVHIDNNGSATNSSFTLESAAPAIFTVNASGTGQGAILNTSYQLVDSSNPAIPGQTYLQIYCMGLGGVTNLPADGAPASSNPLSQTASQAQVTIGGVETTASFTGLAPGFVGLYQVNVLVPSSVASGSAVQLSISIGGATSNTVTIAVQ